MKGRTRPSRVLSAEVKTKRMDPFDMAGDLDLSV